MAAGSPLLRIILRHDYQRIDAAIIWKAVKDDLPPLKEALLALGKSLE
jgi:uncharacterized protein with HEPN domain